MRTKGTGSIFQRGTRWYVAYYDTNMRQRQESAKTDSKRVAEELLRKRLAEVEAGIPVDEVKKLRYEDIKELVIVDYRNNKKKGLEKDEEGKDYIWGFEHLDPFFKDMLVKNISTSLLNQFVTKRYAEKASSGTINRNLSLLRRMMHLAEREGKLNTAPFFPMQKEDNVREGFVEREQFVGLLAKLPEHLRTYVTFLYYTGCRTTAAKLITWSQVEVVGEKVYLNLKGTQNKTGKMLKLPLPMEIASVLRKQFRQDNVAVFNTRNLRKEWDKVRGGVIVNGKVKGGILMHDLRRSGVRNLIRSGVPQSVAMKISGHKTASVFERYNIISTDDIDAAMQAVENKNSGSLMEAAQKKQVEVGIKCKSIAV